VAKKIAVYLEVGSKRTFAGAVDWPGWSRSGRTEQDALDALAVYGARYAKVTRRAKEAFDSPKSADDFDVVERVKGGGGTDFGVPGEIPAADKRAIEGRELARLTRLLETSWATFDSAAKAARGKKLRTGPRGGGRDVPKMVGHVTDAEGAYLGMLGARYRRPPETDDATAVAQIRKAALVALAARSRGETVQEGSRPRKLWEPRYFVRRSAWHALDHAWEIEDRVER
jgi:hypothetical protein